jgi:hypothetical protein
MVRVLEAGFLKAEHSMIVMWSTGLARNSPVYRFEKISIEIMRSGSARRGITQNDIFTSRLRMGR